MLELFILFEFETIDPWLGDIEFGVMFKGIDEFVRGL